MLTHQHMDHLGLLEILARRSGAEVAAFHALGGYLANFSASAAADDEFAQAIMRRHGVPEDLATVLGSVGAAFRAFGSSGSVTRPLRDGDTLELCATARFRVLHRPGHSPSDTIFWDEERRMLIGGDHLLAHISSNPVMSRPLAGDATSGRPPALLNYIESLRATRELPVELVLRGHGDPIVDHVALIDERMRMHDRRARKVLQDARGRPADGVRDRAGHVGQRRGHAGISDALRGARAPRPAGPRRAGPGDRQTTAVAGSSRSDSGELMHETG